MILVETILGNINDSAWGARLAAATLDHLELDQWEAQKNRMRKRSRGGAELALSLERNSRLRDGDILVWDEAKRSAVLARISLQDVMIVHLDSIARQAPDAIARACFEIGHALGNQHWPAVVKDTRVFVPLTVDRKVMESVMRTHDFEGVRVEFIPGEGVIPYLAPHEARRLFGGANSTPHSHLPDDQATHAYSHTHTHPDGTTHSHPHKHPHSHPHGHEHGHSHG